MTREKMGRLGMASEGVVITLEQCLDALIDYPDKTPTDCRS